MARRAKAIFPRDTNPTATTSRNVGGSRCKVCGIFKDTRLVMWMWKQEWVCEECKGWAGDVIARLQWFKALNDDLKGG
jgi:hypothetical protein